MVYFHNNNVYRLEAACSLVTGLCTFYFLKNKIENYNNKNQQSQISEQNKFFIKIIGLVAIPIISFYSLKYALAPRSLASKLRTFLCLRCPSIVVMYARSWDGNAYFTLRKNYKFLKLPLRLMGLKAE